MQCNKQSRNTVKASSSTNSTIDNAVLLNKDLPSTAFRLYCLLAMLAGDDNKVCIKIKELAELMGRASRTVQRDLNILIGEGIIERVLQVSPDEPKQNIPSLFVIHDCVRDNQEA